MSADSPFRYRMYGPTGPYPPPVRRALRVQQNPAKTPVELSSTLTYLIMSRRFGTGVSTAATASISNPPPHVIVQGPVTDSTSKPTAGEETEKMCWQCGRTFTTAMEVCPDDGARLIETDVEHREDPLIGSVFDGRFRIYGKLGEGGMGAVYSARRLDFETDVALKLLKLDFTSDEGIRKRFMYEARVISNLRHPHAIQVFDFGQTSEGHVYMVMELLEGESLADRLAYRFVSYREMFDIIPPICGVLGEAHTRDVIHRDLKPENIFLLEVDGNEEFPKLLDFGIAKHNRAETMTKSGTLWGTPAYMSPEQARGDSVGASADIYGIGIMLYELISGNLPFNASTQMGYAVRHINETARPPSTIPGLSSIPPEFEEFLMSMLAKEPEARPESMEEVAATLKEVRDDLFDPELLDSIPAREVDPIGLQGWLDDSPDISREMETETPGNSGDAAAMADTAAMATADTAAFDSGSERDEDRTLAGTPPEPELRSTDFGDVETRAYSEQTEELSTADDEDDRPAGGSEAEAATGALESPAPDEQAGAEDGPKASQRAMVVVALLVVLLVGAALFGVLRESEQSPSEPEVEEQEVTQADDVDRELSPDRDGIDGDFEDAADSGLDAASAAPAAASHAIRVNLRALGIIADIDPDDLEDELGEDFDFLHEVPAEEVPAQQTEPAEGDGADERQRLQEALEQTF